MFTKGDDPWEYFSGITIWGKAALFYLKWDYLQRRFEWKKHTIRGTQYSEMENHKGGFDLYIKSKGIYHVLGYTVIGYPPTITFDDDEIHPEDLPWQWDNDSMRLFFDAHWLVYCEFDGREFWPTTTVGYDSQLKPTQWKPLN